MVSFIGLFHVTFCQSFEIQFIFQRNFFFQFFFFFFFSCFLFRYPFRILAGYKKETIKFLTGIQHNQHYECWQSIKYFAIGNHHNSYLFKCGKCPSVILK